VLSREQICNQPIDPNLKACILGELAMLPGARIVKRKGRLFFQGRNGFEILCERLLEVKTKWVALVEHADLPEDDKWKIFCLLIGGDGRLEEVNGLGLKVTLPARPRH